MADKFLNTGGGGNANISNGSVNIFAATLSADNLEPSKAIKTNSVKQLISTNLEIADVNNLQSELDNVLTNPFVGTLQADDFKGDSIKDKTETSTINLTATEIDLVATSVKVNGQAVDASVDLQDAYNNSVVAETQLTTTKPYTIKAVDTANLLNIDGDTKEVNINGDLLVNGSNLETQISNVEGDITDLQNDKYDKTGGILTGNLIHNGNLIQFNGASSFQIQNAGSCQIQNTGPLSLKTFSTTGDIVMGGTAKVRNLANGTDPTDAVNLSQIPTPVNITDLETKTQNIDLLNTDNTKTTFNQNLITTNITHPSLTSDITMNPGFVNINTTNTFLNSTVELGNLMFPSIASGVDIGVETIGQFRNIYCDKVGGLTVPVAGTDASTKDYVDRLDTSQKRYDIENPVSVNVEVNKPVSWLGIENASFTFEIQKDEIGYTAPINGVAPISVDVPQSFYNRKWNIIPFTANLSEENTKIGFNQNPGFERFYGFPIFDFNSTASFKFKTTGMATAGDLYIGFIDDLTNLNGIVGFTGQSVGGSLYTDGVASGGSPSKWTTGDECFLSVSGGQWSINRVGDPPVGSLPFVDNGKPYYFAIINNEGGGNFVEMEITEVITDYVAPTTKQIGVNGSIEFNSNPVYVDTSDNLVYADSATNIAYPIAGKNYELITKFDPSLTQATLYSDANFTFYWDGINKQPQFSKTFTGFVDTTIILIKGSTPLPFANTLSFATDINPAASSITYFYGGAIADIAFNHVNWSSRTTLTILDENDNTRPSYILEYFTGNVNGAGTFTMKKIL